MTNSDSGTSNQTAHQPGDRVRIRHNPKHDHSYSAEQNQARQALGGQIGSVRERTVAGAYRVAPPGPPERGAWFEADELELTLPPVGSRVRVKVGLHEGRVLVVKQHRGGEVLAEQGPRMGWYDPSEIEPWVTDADGLPVGGTDAPPVDRPVPELRAAIAAIIDALETKLATANQEAQGWLEAALLARGKAEEARDELQAVEAERDALRGKLGAAEADSATLHAALVAERKEVAGWRSRAFAAEAKVARETEEVARLEAALRTRDVQLDESRTQRKAAEAKLAAVAQAWQACRTRWSPASEDEQAALETVDKALGGAAVKPAERECCWEQTVEQRVSEIEARLGRLESGEAAKRAEGDRIFGGSK